MQTMRINWPKTLKTIALHILFWVFIVSYFAWGFGLNESPKRSFLNALYYLPGHFIMVYSLIYILVPKYLLKRKFLYFFIGLLIAVLFCVFYTIIAQLSVSGSRDIKGMTLTIGRNVMPFLHVGGIALSLKLLEYWYEQKRQTLEAEKQKSIAELKLLKAQLHPHFLFNTLNNLYSHTLENSAKAPEIALKLSTLLRFMIYESNVPRIPLVKEIELLKNYIALEKLRYGDRLDMSVSITGRIESYQIAPLLLLPFLENAFKHGTSKQIDQCWISLDISIKDSVMLFKLINSVEPSTKENKKQAGGLGLQNVKLRLELIYKKGHYFETILQDEVFIVNLNLNLEKLEDVYIDKVE